MFSLCQKSIGLISAQLKVCFPFPYKVGVLSAYHGHCKTLLIVGLHGGKGYSLNDSCWGTEISLTRSASFSFCCPQGKLPTLSPSKLPEAVATGRKSSFLKGFSWPLLAGRGHGQGSATLLKGKAQGS